MYKFSMEPLLKHRQYIEDIQKQDLSEFKRMLVDEKKKLKVYQKAKDKLLKELYVKQQEGITASENLLYFDFFNQLSIGLDKQKERLLDIENKIYQKHCDLINAMKNRKTLDRLKENEMNEYRHEILVKEQEFFNEVGINTYNRRM
ncbi:MAG: flagellar export protein FliJ [Thermodesulfobacteriota bacterium]|nr:flagellar export protein FliJ [Thermodesulfobacteriota bacterium]